MFDGMLGIAAYLKIFVAMIVIVNPLGIIPIFVTMTTSHSERERKHIARIAAQLVGPIAGAQDIVARATFQIIGITGRTFVTWQI